MKKWWQKRIIFERFLGKMTEFRQFVQEKFYLPVRKNINLVTCRLHPGPNALICRAG